MLYGFLETGVATAAASSPFLIDAVRAVHIPCGGSVILGESGAALLRLVFTALFMGVPPSNAPVDFEVIDILTFRDEKIVEHRVVVDRYDLLRQLGTL